MMGVSYTKRQGFNINLLLSIMFLIKSLGVEWYENLGKAFVIFTLTKKPQVK